MTEILVIGGGFAGVWSALGAARVRRSRGVAAGDLHVTLVSSGDDLVIRPRLYEADPERMRVPLDRVLGPVGVRRLAATVTDIDTERRRVGVVWRDGRTTDLRYNRLVLAAGSQLIRPQLPGAEHVHDVDTLPGAAALDAHLRRLADRPAGAGRFTAVVVGAGFTGVEVATELVGRLRAVAEPLPATDEVRVVLVERAGVIGPDLGAGPRPEITRALVGLGIEPRLGVTLTAVDPDGARLSDQSWLAAGTVVWTAGMRPSPLTAAIPADRDWLGRLRVDRYLRVAGVPDVYAAGDTAAALAQDGHRVVQSCQHASQLGRYAGHNVAADLLGLQPEPFTPDPYVTCLDLGAAGAVFTTGWERTVALTGQAAKAVKRTINQVWIYPPVDDEAAILGKADLRATRREREDLRASVHTGAR